MTNLSLAIGLPLRNSAALDDLIRNLYDPASSRYRKFLSVGEFTAQFGPTPEDYEKLKAFAGRRHLKIETEHPNRMVLDVRGSVADIEQAFGVRLQVYQHPKEQRRFYALDREPKVDADLPVLDIMGLDNYVVPHPMDLRRVEVGAPQGTGVVAYAEVGSGPGGLFIGTDFPHAYVPGVTNTGAGQYIGLLEFGPYWTNDIYVYQTNAHLATNIIVNNIFLDGVTEPPTPGLDAGEQALDIEMSMCMAPGSTIMYYGGNVVNDIVNRMATDNLAKQMSSSFGFGINATTIQIYKEFLAQGQNLFQASGDGGAEVGDLNGGAALPFHTLVGGTALSTVTTNGPWQSEKAWVGSGGGISTFYGIPDWQQGINMQTNGGSTTMRNFPDVAAMADTVIFIAANGGTGGVGGTSCSSPLWCGFCALVNQTAASLGQPRVGFINPALYALGKGPYATYTNCFHDITTGNTTNSASGTNRFFAGPGYDLCTGWGSPNGSNLIAALVGIGPTNFMFYLSPSSVTLTAGGSEPALIVAAPANGLLGSVSLSIAGLPSGVSASFNPPNTTTSGYLTNVSVLTLTTSPGAATGAFTATVTGVSGVVTQSSALPLTIVPATPGATEVSLSAAFNLAGIYTDGTSFSGGGLDGDGNVFSATLLSSVLSWNGCLFARGSANASDVIKCSGQTISLPSGSYSSLNILATAVGGSQSAQPFVVTYSDGTSSSYVQNLSDWTYFGGNPGESLVASTAYRVTSGGTADTVTMANVYGYSYGLNNKKTVRSLTLPYNGNVIVMAMTLANDFTLYAAPTPPTITEGGTLVSFLNASVLDGQSGAIGLSAVGLPSGMTASFAPSNATASSLFTFKAGVSEQPSVGGIVTVSGALGNLTHSYTYKVSVLGSMPVAASASLSSAYNVAAIYNNGTTFSPTGGADYAGDAYSANLIGSAPSWNGTVFGLGPANGADAVKCAGQTITLPSGQFPTLLLLAAGVNGNQPGQTFVANYNDGSSSSFTQSVSSWTAPQGYAGEAIAISTGYINTSTGTSNTSSPAYVYGYSFGLNDNRTLASLSLPNNTNVLVLAVTAANAAVPVSLSPYFNRAGVYTNGSAFSGGLDADGNAYSANLLGPAPIWNNITFNLGPSNTLDAISCAAQTVELPSGRYTSLAMLATAVNGSQSSQTFIVNYADGTSATFTQSLSDWAATQGYTGESIVTSMPYRNGGGGTPNGSTVNLYGYSFTLNNTKTVQSLKLPNNSNVEVLALALGSAPVPVSLTSAANRAGIYTDGTKFTNTGGLDLDGSAYSANLLGALRTWKGSSFVFGPPNLTNSVSGTGQTISLPLGQYSSLSILATGVDGNQTSQSFAATYTNNTTATFTQSLSDWFTPQNYSGESNVVQMAYRDTSNGTPDNRPFNLYGYTFALNSNNVLQSVKLPNNGNVEVLAITLANALTPVPEAPLVTNQPQNLTVTNGSPAAFTIKAIGSPPLAYQWLKWQNGVTNLIDGGNISGSTSNMLMLSTTSISDAAGYSVVVTNAYGSATSQVATLTVILPSPVFQPPVISNGYVVLAWNSATGSMYQVEYSSDLSSNEWLDLGPPIMATNQVMSVSDTIGTNAQRFYQVILIP